MHAPSTYLSGAKHTVRSRRGRTWLHLLLATVALLLPRAAIAHPGTGIVIDRLGNIYFVDMVSGVWAIDTHGVLTHMPGPAFHWLTLDEDNRFSGATLPSGSSGDIVRLGSKPTLLLSSDVPVAIGRDGILYYPSHGSGNPLQLLRMLASGRRSVVAPIPAGPGPHPLRELNGVADGPRGSVYYTEKDALRRIDSAGRLSTVAQNISLTGCASIPDLGSADRPLLRGLAVDSAGVAYVAATGCGSVLKITPGGRVTTLFQGQGPRSPTGVALFGKNVYVLEFLGAGSDDRPAMIPRIRLIAPDGTTTIIATVAR